MLFTVYIIGFIVINIGNWVRYAIAVDEIPDKELPHIKYQSCIGSLLSTVWPISIPGLLINYIIKYKKEEKKKELQQCICPECERKFLLE